ncbi:cache domain-containing protein [Sulfurimonas sp. HSL3-7]|uniref:cache domain-containing protein n=1 Tax=Sulfonitrofixus jiaomeiensis TaxID=3131938 RepID=UPI0031F7F731
MKKTSILFTVSLSLLLIFAVSMGFYLSNALTHAEEKTYGELAEKLIQDLNSEEHLIENIGITNAIYIADNARIAKALIENNRAIAIKELQVIFNNFKKSTKIKNLKVHIHTADLKSFVRSWKLDKFGDDLSGFRKTIVKVKETRQPVFDFEVGRMGLTLRSIVPVIQGDDYLGSLEFIQNFDNVAKQFAKKSNDHLLLMNDSLIFIATDLKDAPSVDHYKLGSKQYDDDFLKAAQSLDLDKLQQKRFIFTDQYLYTYKTIKDVNDNNVGMHLMGMSGQQVQAAVDEAKSSTLTMIIVTVSSLLLLLLLMFFFFKSRC